MGDEPKYPFSVYLIEWDNCVKYSTFEEFFNSVALYV